MTSVAAAERTATDLLLPEDTRLLHIGPPKTATTSLQQAFHRARPATAAQGVHYAGREAQALRASHAAMGRPILGDLAPAIAEWRRFVAEVEAATKQRVLISSEGFSYADPEAIRRIVDDLDAARVHVVMTLRPLARILPSQWQQHVQSGTTASLNGWLEALFAMAPTTTQTVFWTMHRHDELVARWARVVGSERVTVVVIDERDHGFVLRVFERLLGLREGTLVAVPDLANRSLTYPEIEAIRALNNAFRAERVDGDRSLKDIRLRAVGAMRRRQPGSDEPRIETPQWALDRAGEIAREMVAGIAASGVRVVGDLDSLAAAPNRPAGGRAPDPSISPDIAAAMAMGLLTAIGVIPEAATTGRPSRPPNLAWIPTRRIASVLVRRAGRAVVRR